MTEFDKADLNNNGVIEKAEWNKIALEDRRLEMVDRDLKRNAERRFTGFALAGMLIYPFIILLASSWMNEHGKQLNTVLSQSTITSSCGKQEGIADSLTVHDFGESTVHQANVVQEKLVFKNTLRIGYAKNPLNKMDKCSRRILLKFLAQGLR